MFDQLSLDPSKARQRQVVAGDGDLAHYETQTDYNAGLSGGDGIGITKAIRGTTQGVFGGDTRDLYELHRTGPDGKKYRALVERSPDGRLASPKWVPDEHDSLAKTWGTGAALAALAAGGLGAVGALGGAGAGAGAVGAAGAGAGAGADLGALGWGLGGTAGYTLPTLPAGYGLGAAAGGAAGASLGAGGGVGAGGGLTAGSGAAGTAGALGSSGGLFGSGITTGQALGIGGNLLGGVLGSNAASDAADTQARSAAEANALSKYMYDTTRADNLPALRARNNGLAGYQNLLQHPDSITSDPGYQFGLDQGNKSIGSHAAAGGSYFSGATLKALQKYGQDYAGTKMDQTLDRYGRLSGLGSSGASTIANSGANYANQAGNNITGAGNALAAGQVGSANAWNNALGGAISGYQQSQIVQPFLDYYNKRNGN
jgi:hypothetical protein